MDVLAILSSSVNIHLFVAALLGAIIGLERELAGKDPSLRTFALISVGSCIFSMLSLDVALDAAHADPGRIAAQIIPGIGFLGAGTIFRQKRGVSGLTTAALMWVTAGIGMGVGLNRIDLAVSTTIVALFITFGLKYVHRWIQHLRPVPYAKTLEADDKERSNPE
ncbi:MAG: MgtC/SapB family protein [Deltaproteobacteria bacterium]|nr:MgtC/SapB family protein [Deltaproteobacteria bacterium]